MKHGVPFDVAFSLPPDEAVAWSIIFGQMEGNVWCWDTLRWKDPDK